MVCGYPCRAVVSRSRAATASEICVSIAASRFSWMASNQGLTYQTPVHFLSALLEQVERLSTTLEGDGYTECLQLGYVYAYTRAP